jgi:hypothetical protein
MRTFLLALLLTSAATTPAFACCRFPTDQSGWRLAQVNRGIEELHGDHLIGQNPEGLSAPAPDVPGNAVILVNFGNSTARLQYWNPTDKNWTPVEIPTRGRITIQCEKCDKQIKASFHDGHDAQTAVLDLGEAYGWYWKGDTQRWAIAQYGAVQRTLEWHPEWYDRRWNG